MGYGELLHKSEQRTISPAICVYIDANGLHELNNERGHEAGDLMLRFVAEPDGAVSEGLPLPRRRR